MSKPTPLSNARRSRWAVRSSALLLSAFSCVACENELGECDPEAARELVYSSSGLVATKGQALVHDSCGQGTFCHSAAAKGKNRQGVPVGLDFDLLPQPKSIHRVVQLRDQIWDLVLDGQMPPKGFAVGDGDWRFALENRESSLKLPALSTAEGKGVLRNWLACGAPAVEETAVPAWATRSTARPDPAEAAWTDLHRGMRNNCVSSGCHDGGVDPTAVTPGALSVPLLADECSVYRWLLFNRDQCGQRLVVGGDPGASALIHKLEDSDPACGQAMPPPLPSPATDKAARATEMAALVASTRQWVEAGAFAPQCGEWSDLALRTGVEAPATGPVTWKSVHTSVIVPRCATAGCHDSNTKAGELPLIDRCGAWAALQKSGACGVRVIPGQPALSSLYSKITSPQCGTLMPPTGALPTAQVALIRSWIEEGASGEECE